MQYILAQKCAYSQHVLEGFDYDHARFISCKILFWYCHCIGRSYRRQTQLLQKWTRKLWLMPCAHIFQLLKIVAVKGTEKFCDDFLTFEAVYAPL